MSEYGSWAKMCRNTGAFPARGRPYLCYFDGGTSEVHDASTATVLIPSFHPGFLSRSGMVKQKATRLFVLTAGVAWCAMSVALTIAQAGEPADREAFAKMIIAQIESQTGPKTAYGKALETARKEYEDCHQAYVEGWTKRKEMPKLKMPTGILPRKSIRSQRKSRYTTAMGVEDVGNGGWDLTISQSATYGGNQGFYTLSWTEDDEGNTCEISPIPLGKDVVQSNDGTIRQVFL